MAKKYATPWQRYKFLLNGLILILPAVFLYQSLNPVFPDPLPAKSVGDYIVVPMPYDLNPAYQHDGVYVKDFLLTFKQGDIATIRQGFLNIGSKPYSLTAIKQRHDGEGFLHGNRHAQHVHGLVANTLSAHDSIWLTLEGWDGRIHTARWDMPAEMLAK